MKKNELIMHSSVTWEHFTPRKYVEAARETMGRIDLDPASCVGAQETVYARRFFDKSEDGLSQEWFGKVWLNPPGGKLKKPDPTIEKYKTRSRAVSWWRALSSQFASGKVSEAVFLAFNIEMLSNGQDPSGSFLDPLKACAICIPNHRIRFSGNQPTHSNAILYLGRNAKKFQENFVQFGSVQINRKDSSS